MVENLVEQTSPHHPTRDGLLWTAGFLEAEGYFRKSYVEAKQIGGSESVVRLARYWGGNIDLTAENRRNHRGGYRWRVHGEQARALMRALLELEMSERRRTEIKEALNEQAGGGN
jgi:hypothetical protein